MRAPAPCVGVRGDVAGLVIAGRALFCSLCEVAGRMFLSPCGLVTRRLLGEVAAEVIRGVRVQRSGETCRYPAEDHAMAAADAGDKAGCQIAVRAVVGVEVVATGIRPFIALIEAAAFAEALALCISCSRLLLRAFSKRARAVRRVNREVRA